MVTDYSVPDTLSPTSQSSSDSASEPVLVSATVKIICPNEKLSEHKVFMLKDVDLGDITTTSSLREEIYSQFGSEYIDNDSQFDICYFSGTKRIWIRNKRI